MILGDVLKYLNRLCAVINQNQGLAACPSTLSDNAVERVEVDMCSICKTNITNHSQQKRLFELRHLLLK